MAEKKETIELIVEINRGVLEDVRFAKKGQAKKYDLVYELIDHDIACQD